MKTIKTVAVVSVLVFGMTTSVFASWWNPFSWNIFKRNVNKSLQIATNSLPVDKPMEKKDEKKSVNDIKVGDNFGTFKVISFDKSNTGFGYSVKFSGETTVIGKYFINEALGSAPCIVVSEESIFKIPRYIGDNRSPYFCMNDSAVEQLQGNEGNIITLKIKNYYLVVADKGVSDMAEFVEFARENKVEEINGWKTYTDNTYGFKIKYPSSWFQSIHGASLVLSTGDLKKGDVPSISILPLDGSKESKFVVYDNVNNDLSHEIISTLEFTSLGITFQTVTPMIQLPTVVTNIVVTYPNGGEKLDVNEQDSMPKEFNFVTRWTSNNLTGTTNIYLISATDGSVCLLGSAPVNQRAFGAVLGASFKCKNTSKLLTSSQYKVRLIADTQSSSSDLGVNDMSDNYFTLNVVSTNSQTMPKISSIEVVEGLPVGSVYAGQTAEIFGTNLRSVVSVKIGEQNVPVMTGVIADRALDTDQAFKVPSLPAGVYNVSVTNSFGQVSSVYPVTVVVYSPR